jgi:energy-coupling factor transporter ATP-binding protein EcfA2
MADPLTPVDDRHPLPFTPWASFFAGFDWRQGEHVTVVGPTGTGKTTVIRAILPKRYAAGGAVAVLATKPRDRNLEAWARADNMTTVRSWPPRPPQFWRPPGDIVNPDGTTTRWDHRVMVWPQPAGMALGDVDQHIADTHRAAFTDMYWSGNWCIVAEELWELSRLGLDPEMSQVWTQGRSAGLSLVGATQRPVSIPLFAYSQPSHLFMFGDNDEVNLRRLQGIGGMSGSTLREAVQALRGFDVLYIGTRTRELIRTRVPVRKVSA